MFLNQGPEKIYQLSYQQEGPLLVWLGYIGDDKLPSYMGIIS